MLRSLFLLLIGLLLLVSCTKKADDPPTPVFALGTGSYQFITRQPAFPKYDSLSATCLSLVIPGTSGSSDDIEVDMTTTPEPKGGRTVLKLYFSKPSGQPNTAFKLDYMFLFANGALQATTFFNTSGTLVPTSDGAFSGTFAGTNTGVGQSGSPYYAIKSGVFTNVR